MRPITERLRAEFLEMPGLRLTVAQTQRLCGVDQTVCHAALDTLVQAQFLRVNPDGTYARFSDGETAARYHKRSRVTAEDAERQQNNA